MKKLLITLLFTALAVSAYSQLPTGSISNKRGFFFELKGRDTLGAYTGKIKMDTLELVSGQKLYRLTDTAAIYNLLNSKIDSVSKSNDTLFFHRDNTTPLAIAITGLSDTPTLTMVLTKNGQAPTKSFMVDTARAYHLKFDSVLWQFNNGQTQFIQCRPSKNDTSFNLAVGRFAFVQHRLDTMGYANTVFGNYAAPVLRSNTASRASTNSVFGYRALNLGTSCSFNSLFGVNSGAGITTQDRNCYFGYHSGQGARGWGSCGFGDRVLTLDSSLGSCAFGQLALTNNTYGVNCAFGNSSLLNNSTGNDNAAYGTLSLTANTTGNNNVGVGAQSLVANTIGVNNTAVGKESLRANISGTNNTANGYRALYACTGDGNVGNGINAGFNITSADNCIVIGAGIGVASPTTNGQLNIGDIIYGQDIYGASGKIGIGYLNDTLTHTLQVQGTASISNRPRGLSGDSLVVADDTTGQLKSVGFSFGTYTPTLTTDANLDSAIAFTLTYQRIGSVVTVSGKVNIATTGALPTVLGISLPVASNFTDEHDAGGVAQSLNLSLGAAITADPTNDRLQLRFVESSAGSRQMYFTATYTIK